MKASKKSIHAELYRITYNSELPKNLCPYFWKLVWATIIFIPNVILQFPSWIENLFEKQEDRTTGGHRTCGILIYFALIALYLYIRGQIEWIKAMFNFYSYDSGCANAGWFMDLIALIVILIYLIRRKILSIKKEVEVVEQEKKPSIIIEFIKAKYNKYCPKIDWE